MQTSISNRNEHDESSDGLKNHNNAFTDRGQGTNDRSLTGLQSFFSLFCTKWSVAVMVALSHEAIEYSNPAAKSSARRPSVRRTALDERVPEASTKVLTDTLKRLERAGLVQREIIAAVPFTSSIRFRRKALPFSNHCAFLEIGATIIAPRWKLLNRRPKFHSVVPPTT